MFKMRAKMITVGLLGTAAILPLDLAKADQVGHASWYALHSRTASGEQMNPDELTAAHRSLPFGTRVLVENLTNGRSVVVRINDRGPFVGGRIIDLSKAAAASIGMIDTGTAQVRVTTTGGGALAALGKSASDKSITAAGKSEAAASQIASASATVTFEAKSTPTTPVKKVAKATSGPAEKVGTTKTGSGKAQNVASHAASKMKQAAKSSGSKGKVAAASKTVRSAAKISAKSTAKGSTRSTAKTAAKSSIKTAAKSSAKSRSSQGHAFSSDKRTRTASRPNRQRRASTRTIAHLYPVLGQAPGFMKPAGRPARVRPA
jgi:rare lipoprotein A